MGDHSELLILAGPTGVGKSELALEIARGRGAIVSADSMQVYRGLAIGTAQPSREEQDAIPHRLVGCADPREMYDAARFVTEAEAALAELRARGLLPLIVGGTGMYIRSLTSGLFEGPSRDAEVRRALHEQSREQGPEALHARLAEVDPEAAARIQPRDEVRIVRALEVFQTTGRPISAWQRESRQGGPRHARKLAILTRDREDLHDRIHRRTLKMLEAGWIEETRALLEAGVPRDAPGFRALGYREILLHLDGALAEADLPAAIALASRQYAKRQLTWFRAERDAVWINLTPLTPAQALRAIGQAWGLAVPLSANPP